MILSSKDEGFVLPSVLWVIALLSLLVLTLTQTTRLNVRAQANDLVQRDAQLRVDGAVRTIAFLLSLGGNAPEKYKFASGEDYHCSQDGTSYTIRVTDVAGLVDLNATPKLGLFTFLKGLGVEQGRASRLADQIVDARDRDDVTLNGDQEIDAYHSAGFAHGPKNLPLESVGELDQLPDMSPELLGTLETMATVYSRRPNISFQLAPKTLVKALTLDRSEYGYVDDQPKVAAKFSRLQDVRITLSTSSSAQVSRHAVVALIHNAKRGFVFREWRQPKTIVATDRLAKTTEACALLLSR